MSRKILFVIDMQNDFIDGSLGSDDAKRIVPNVVKLIQNWDNDEDNRIFYTYDTHADNDNSIYRLYENTLEGKMLPIKHCIENTSGWRLNEYVADEIVKRNSLYDRSFQKNTFGCLSMLDKVDEVLIDGTDDEIHLVGLVTNICLINNALLLRAKFPNLHIYVHENCCAGTSKEAHDAAITVMKSCQIEII